MSLELKASLGRKAFDVAKFFTVQEQLDILHNSIPYQFLMKYVQQYNNVYTHTMVVQVEMHFNNFKTWVIDNNSGP